MMIKKNLKKILLIALIIILSVCAGVYAEYLINALQVDYEKSDGTTISVANALDELYGRRLSAGTPVKYRNIDFFVIDSDGKYSKIISKYPLDAWSNLTSYQYNRTLYFMVGVGERRYVNEELYATSWHSSGVDNSITTYMNKLTANKWLGYINIPTKSDIEKIVNYPSAVNLTTNTVGGVYWTQTVKEVGNVAYEGNLWCWDSRNGQWTSRSRASQLLTRVTMLVGTNSLNVQN